jgi:predicted regulator of Ras-like GTPase activity (Roadblock/LC7/MglB family)
MSSVDARPAPTFVPSGRDLKHVLRQLLGLEHVTGGLIVAPDGLVIAAQLPGGAPVEAVSALAAMLGRELELRGPRLRRGTFLMAQFAAGEGTVFLGGTPVGFIVLLAERAAEVEAIRRSLRAAVESIRRAFAR